MLEQAEELMVRPLVLGLAEEKLVGEPERAQARAEDSRALRLVPGLVLAEELPAGRPVSARDSRA